MPTVIPISDLQRNVSAIAEECHATGAPIYLTKNGKATLVVMDAAAFDASYGSIQQLKEREERINRAIARGYDDLLNGRTRSWVEAKKDADAIREALNGN